MHCLIVGVSGVAAATALYFAERKSTSKISLIYHSREAEAEVLRASLLQLYAVECHTYKADVTNDAELRSVFALAVATSGPLSHVINAAAITKCIAYEDLDGVTDEVFHSILGVNLVGAFHVTRAAAACMTAGGSGGCILNISSVAAKLAQGSSLPYACSKAALDTMTVGLARTLAPRGIRVLGVAPGFIAGEWLQNLLGDKYEETKALFEAGIPLRKVCSPESVAEVIHSLCFGASMITGQTITVDGGMTIAGFKPF